MSKLASELQITRKLDSQTARQMLGRVVSHMLTYRTRLAYITGYRVTIFLKLGGRGTDEGASEPCVYYSRVVRNSNRVDAERDGDHETVSLRLAMFALFCWVGGVI